MIDLYEAKFWINDHWAKVANGDGYVKEWSCHTSMIGNSVTFKRELVDDRTLEIHLDGNGSVPSVFVHALRTIVTHQPVSMYNQTVQVATKQAPLDVLHLRENPPFKLDRLQNVDLLLEGTFDDLSLLPSQVSQLTINLPELRSLQGISRYVQVSDRVHVHCINPSAVGYLELAMIAQRMTHLPVPTPNGVGSSVATNTLKLITAHVNQHGKGKRILELRKKLIEVGCDYNL